MSNSGLKLNLLGGRWRQGLRKAWAANYSPAGHKWPAGHVFEDHDLFRSGLPAAPTFKISFKCEGRKLSFCGPQMEQGPQVWQTWGHIYIPQLQTLTCVKFWRHIIFQTENIQ